MGSIASAVGGLVGGIGGMISGDAAAGAANEQAEYLRNLSAEQRKNITDAAAAAAARGQFKPVTVTSAFGTPQYTYDESGRLTGVSTTPAPWLASLQQRQAGLLPQYMGLTEAALSSAPDYAAAAAQARQAGTNVYDMAAAARQQAQGVYDVGQEMYGLGRSVTPYAQQAYGTSGLLGGLGMEAAQQAAAFRGAGEDLAATGADIYGRAAQALPTSYDTTQATQDYYTRMQQLVAPERERQLAKTRQGLFNTGRAGLAIGATQEGGQLATNPEMAAYYNAIAQQDLSLANQAEQQALSNLAQRTAMGQGLYNTGLQQYQAGLGAQQQGLGALTTAGGLYGQGMGALQTGAGLTSTGANILGQGVGATQAGTGQLSSAANMYGQGTGLFGMAGDIQNSLYRNISASQAPFATGMQATTGLEQTAYSPVTQGMGYAGLVTPAEQWAGQIGLSGATSAANVATSMAPQIANYQYQNSSYSPWGSLLQGMGSSLGSSNMGSWSSLFSGGSQPSVAPSYTQAISNYGSGGQMFGQPTSGWSWR